VLDLSVFDMTEDLLATNINAEEEVMTIEPSTIGCGMEASGKQVQSTDLGNCAQLIIAAWQSMMRRKTMNYQQVTGKV
jgi:hypothetical protein